VHERRRSLYEDVTANEYQDDTAVGNGGVVQDSLPVEEIRSLAVQDSAIVYSVDQHGNLMWPGSAPQTPSTPGGGFTVPTPSTPFLPPVTPSYFVYQQPAPYFGLYSVPSPLPLAVFPYPSTPTPTSPGIVSPATGGGHSGSAFPLFADDA